MRCTAGCGLSGAGSVASGRAQPTVRPLRTSRAAATRFSAVMWFSVPSWSRSPHRPQFESDWRNASISRFDSAGVGIPHPRDHGARRQGPAAVLTPCAQMRWFRRPVEAKRGAALTRRVLERIGNPLEWSDIDKALVVQALQGPMAFVLLLRGRYMIRHPESEPYYDRGLLAILIQLLGLHVGLTVVFVAVGLWLRHAQRGGRGYVYVSVLYWWLVFALIAYLHGLATTPLWTVFPLLGFFTLLLFDLRVALSGILTALFFTYASAVGERLGLVPYAPVFSE